MRLATLFAFVTVLALPISRLHGATMTFEGVAATGSNATVIGYTENGFKITPNAFILDSGVTTVMVGNGTDWAGFDPHGQTLTFASASGSPFTLIDMLVGPSTHPLPVQPAGFSFEGHLAAGGLLASSLSNLTTATVATFNWAGLSSVVIRASSASILVGVDNINAVATPEPTAATLAAIAMLATPVVRRRRV